MRGFGELLSGVRRYVDRTTKRHILRLIPVHRCIMCGDRGPGAICAPTRNTVYCATARVRDDNMGSHMTGAHMPGVRTDMNLLKVKELKVMTFYAH